MGPEWPERIYETSKCMFIMKAWIINWKNVLKHSWSEAIL